MPHPVSIPDDIALRTGPILLGNLFGYCLYGILVVQLLIYHHKFTKDPTWIKALVWFLFFIDTLITILATIAAWNFLAQGWGDPAILVPLDWPYGGVPLLSGLVSYSVHLFFCWRIWKLREIVIFPIFIAMCSLLAWAMASYCGIHGLSLGVIRINKLGQYVIVWLGGTALVDLLITFFMVMVLFQASSRSAFEGTYSLLHRLITLTIETGMTTCIVALVELVLFLVFPENNMHFLPFLILAKLYSNTLLTSLNARAFLNQSHISVPPLWDDTSFSLPPYFESQSSPTSPGDSGTHSPIHSGYDMAVLEVYKSDTRLTPI